MDIIISFVGRVTDTKAIPVVYKRVVININIVDFIGRVPNVHPYTCIQINNYVMVNLEVCAISILAVSIPIVIPPFP